MLALVLATLAYFFALVIAATVFTNLPPVSRSLQQGSGQAIGSAAFLLVASVLAPSARKELVSLYLSLLAVLASAVVWRSNLVAVLPGTFIGAACVVAFFRVSAKPGVRSAMHTKPLPLDD